MYVPHMYFWSDQLSHLECSFNQTFVSASSQTAGMHRLEERKWLIQIILCCPLGPLIVPIYMQMIVFIYQGNSKALSALDCWLTAFVKKRNKKKKRQALQLPNSYAINTQTANTSHAVNYTISLLFLLNSCQFWGGGQHMIETWLHHYDAFIISRRIYWQYIKRPKCRGPGRSVNSFPAQHCKPCTNAQSFPFIPSLSLNSSPDHLQFILLSPGCHVLLLSVVPHATYDNGCLA